MEITPSEINILFESYNNQQEEKSLRLKQLAYNIGGCFRHAQAEDAYPDFDEIFPEHPGEVEALSDEEVRAQAKAKGLKSPD
jgi:hypothetical protein